MLTQLPIASLIPSVGNIVTVKLDDSNYVNSNFQMELLLNAMDPFRILPNLLILNMRGRLIIKCQ